MSVCFVCFVLAEGEEATGAMSMLTSFISTFKSYLDIAAKIIIFIGILTLILGWIGHDNTQKWVGVLVMVAAFIFKEVVEWLFG